MTFFRKKPANPADVFESEIKAAIARARQAGLGQSTIGNILESHGASYRRLANAERERRHFGNPVYVDASLPQ